jgi:hypothetical protein
MGKRRGNDPLPLHPIPKNKTWPFTQKNRHTFPGCTRSSSAVSLPSPFVHLPYRVCSPFCAGERAALVHLRSSGFRHSTPRALAPGYSVPHHHHLIGPMRPTRRHISISPTRLIRDALAVRHTSTPRRPASGSVLSLAILCRHVALRDPGKPVGCLYPVPSPTTLAFDLVGRSRHFPHPPPSESRGGVHFGA